MNCCKFPQRNPKAVNAAGWQRIFLMSACSLSKHDTSHRLCHARAHQHAQLCGYPAACLATKRHQVLLLNSSCTINTAHLFPALSSHQFLQLWELCTCSCKRSPGAPQVHTCFAAILEDPTMFPLLSRTSIPSSSSVCLIRTTLQILALAEDEKSMMISSAALVNTKWQASVLHDIPSALISSVCQEVS